MTCAHRFEAPDPPEWMDTDDWTDHDWRNWYDTQFDFYCVYCGEQDG